MIGQVAMLRNICFLFIAAKLNLMVLLLLATSFLSCFNDRVAEFALTKKENSDVKEQNEQESVEELDLDSEDLEVFYPTNQWQVVHQGQAIPAGLHVQLNLQTGENLAKLPDDNHEKSDLKDSPRSSKRLGQVDLDPSSFTTQELKKALAKMKESLKTDDTLEQKVFLLKDVCENTTDNLALYVLSSSCGKQFLHLILECSVHQRLWPNSETLIHQEDVRKRFRSIDKLKEEFKELNLQLETDFEIMFKLINKFNSSASTLEEKIAALHDLEYYVHQVDNAKDLLSLGGLQLLINGLNSSEPLMKEYASFVLGAALSR
ncbi:hypothetical protein lerEdw1_019322 [Lerista edwardsae]|nr:hypothetical protein lerEdw1_019322 [Lerista edwardsae]